MKYDEENLEKIRQRLDVYCPSPEANLINLGLCVARLSPGEKTAKIRRLVLDIDDLTAQIRWHLGQGLLLMDSHPDILNASKDGADIIEGFNMPVPALLLLRDGVVEADRVIYGDLSTPRRGGTVAGWIFHMMIDSAIFRAVSALDRLANILWFVAELPKERVYFRSGKVSKLHKVISSKETTELFRIADSELLNLILSYRDGLSHNNKAYSKVSGFTPSERWKDETGRTAVWADNM